MVLVEGENGDGALVEEEKFDVDGDPDSGTYIAAEQVISAILGTREGAAEGGERFDQQRKERHGRDDLQGRETADHRRSRARRASCALT